MEDIAVGRCEVHLTSYYKMSDNQQLTGESYDVTITVFRLDICSDPKSLLFLCGCEAQTPRDCLHCQNKITKKSFFYQCRLCGAGVGGYSRDGCSLATVKELQCFQEKHITESIGIKKYFQGGGGVGKAAKKEVDLGAN